MSTDTTPQTVARHRSGATLVLDTERYTDRAIHISSGAAGHWVWPETATPGATLDRGQRGESTIWQPTSDRAGLWLHHRIWPDAPAALAVVCLPRSEHDRGAVAMGVTTREVAHIVRRWRPVFVPA